MIGLNAGFVAKYMGDGVLAYFGYPQASEHDAERAVRAGLSLIGAVPNLQTAAGVPLSVRIGIATGLVVVGDLIGTGAALEQAVVGETPNLAARLTSVPFSSLAGIRRPVSLRTRRSPLFATCWIRSATPARSARPTPLKRRSHQRAADEPSPPSI